MDARGALDGLLELGVIGSFSRIGYHLRRRLHAWSDPLPHALAGRTVVITGPTSGLGRATAASAAALGARVVQLARVQDPAAPAAVRRRARYPQTSSMRSPSSASELTTRAA